MADYRLTSQDKSRKCSIRDTDAGIVMSFYNTLETRDNCQLVVDHVMLRNCPQLQDYLINFMLNEVYQYAVVEYLNIRINPFIPRDHQHSVKVTLCEVVGQVQAWLDRLTITRTLAQAVCDSDYDNLPRQDILL